MIKMLSLVVMAIPVAVAVLAILLTILLRKEP